MAGKSRRKGKAGERELAAFLRGHGFDDARRGQQYAGPEGDADVIGLPGIHIDSKRCEALRLWEALEHAKREAQPGSIPTVWHRSSRRPWVVVLHAEDFISMVHKNGR